MLKNVGNASVVQGELRIREKADVGETKEDAPVDGAQLMERVVERGNLLAALKRVRSNGGCPGIDGMSVDALPGYLKSHWPEIKAALLSGTYQPQAVKRIGLPKPGGGVRELGVPTVLDRFIQQAVLQVLQPVWDSTFSDHSYGFRPKRSAHQAIEQAQRYLGEGYGWVVDLDVEKFFDRVNHDLMMHKVKERVGDKRVLALINRYLKASVEIEGRVERRTHGTPQGGPLSPLLANLLLDELDKELEKRGHRYVRYADDCNVYVRSQKAGERVLASLTRFLERRLKLQVRQMKSAVDRPWRRTFLGFTFSNRRGNRRKVSEGALRALKTTVRQVTCRTRGHSLQQVVAELSETLLGWKAYFGFAEVVSPLRDLDKWIRRRLRSYLWKQWGRAGYRALRERGVDRQLAWNTCKSAHGPWRLSKSPALYQALPNRLFTSLGLPSLADRVRC